MSCKRIAIGAATLFALAGCSATSPSTSIHFDPTVGEAVKYNAALHTIDPDPVYPEGSAEPGANGEVGAAAVKRYRQNKVKPVQTIRTGTTTGGGSL